MNLVQGLLEEIDRVTKIQGEFKKLLNTPGVIVAPQIAIMEHEITQAKEAIGTADVVEMLRCHATLKEYES